MLKLSLRNHTSWSKQLLIFCRGNYTIFDSFPTVESFNQTVYPPNGVRVYKPLTNKTAPRDGDYDVVFGIAAAYGGSDQLFYTWLSNGRQGEINPFGNIGILALSNLPDTIDPLIEVEVILSPPTNQELVAYLHLLGKHQCTCTYVNMFPNTCPSPFPQTQLS